MPRYRSSGSSRTRPALPAATERGEGVRYALLRTLPGRAIVIGVAVKVAVALATAILGAMPAFLSVVSIVSRRHGEGATTDDYNSGRAAIGTGPYRFVSWVPQQQVELVRNERYWGERPQWDRVVFRAVPSPAARLAALLAGDLDLIDRVPTADIGGALVKISA